MRERQIHRFGIQRKITEHRIYSRWLDIKSPSVSVMDRSTLEVCGRAQVPYPWSSVSYPSSSALATGFSSLYPNYYRSDLCSETFNILNISYPSYPLTWNVPPPLSVKPNLPSFTAQLMLLLHHGTAVHIHFSFLTVPTFWVSHMIINHALVAYQNPMEP